MPHHLPWYAYAITAALWLLAVGVWAAVKMRRPERTYDRLFDVNDSGSGR